MTGTIFVTKDQVSFFKSKYYFIECHFSFLDIRSRISAEFVDDPDDRKNHQCNQQKIDDILDESSVINGCFRHISPDAGVIT